MSHVHAFPMHTFSTFSIYLLYLNRFGAFLIVSFLPLSILFTLVVSMAPRCKSTPARNLLRSNASLSSDSAPLSLQVRDKDAYKALSKNFSRCGFHSGSRCVTSQSFVLSCLSRSFTPTYTGLIVQYLFSLLAFEVRAFLSHRSFLRMCLGFLE